MLACMREEPPLSDGFFGDVFGALPFATCFDSDRLRFFMFCRSWLARRLAACTDFW